jgi:hypothetical protein
LTLSHLYAEWINSSKEDKVRDIERLYLSDIGSCHRQIAYRMTGAKRDYESEQEAINRTIMFDLAERIEANLWAALEANSMGIAYQFEVNIDDRENWGGRGDIIADYEGRRVLEVKTVYPGAFNYDLTVRYPQHHYQGRAYHHYCREQYELTAPPLIPYFDRGGQNTPQEIEVSKDWIETAMQMDGLDAVRRNLPELPDRLGKVLNLRRYGKDIVREPDGRCKRPYCKYTSVCKQNMSTSVWATREKTGGFWEPWEVKKAADPVILEEFTSKLLEGV